MNGLRVYTKQGAQESAQKIFYTRRGNGPFYRWLYEETAKDWRPSRVISADFTSQTLAMASWKAVPASLQTRLGEHYLD
jgi:hypothetical protein